MNRHVRVRLGYELTTTLLRKWSEAGVPLSLRIVIAAKFNTLFTGGRLSEVGKNTGLFYYITPGVFNLVSPEDFKRREREETDTFERLIFSDSNWTNIMQVIRPKDEKPILIENLSSWVN